MTCVALVVCAWFAIGVRQAHDLNQATSIVDQSSQPTKAQIAHAGSLLNAAAFLNPDSNVKLVRAELALGDNENAQGRRIVQGVLRDEPQNLQAWYLLAQSAGSDQHLLFRALAQVTKLDPPPPKKP
jgi:predicted Zn-dependent protease